MQIIVIGHSHIAAIETAYQKYSTHLNFNASFINLSAPEYLTSGDDTAAMEDILHEASDDLQPDVIVTCFDGNVHNLFGLLEHPSRFDFVLAESADLPAEQTRELIPSHVIQQLLETRMGNTLQAFEALRHNYALPIVHLESPPTIPSEEHIREYPGVFKELIDERGITPAIIRYKLWRLHSSIVQRACKQFDILFLAVPPETQDQHGMMVQQAWNPDPTHGNDWYGRKVLDQLADLLPEITN